ncbi:hypothetical protein C8R44DRAFT_790757 [Mycena epipterygia]|nr:hypothetical protein C8R44DRAFT_790757 [Mycena epipterygia]
MEKGQEGLPEITVLSLCPRPPSPVPPSPVLTPAPPPRTSVEDCLRNAYVAKVLQHHPESREKLVGSILMENLSIAEPPADDDDHLAAPTSNEAQNRLIEEVFARFVPGVAATKSRLSASFAGRQSALIEKSRRLQHEYQVLHNRWRRHCASLDAGEQRKAIVSAAVAKSGGRRTRSTASLAMSDVASFDDADLTANRAIIPEMVSVIGERYTFDDTNHQVETPPEHYAPIIDTWTEAEKELFLEKYAAFPKQFGLVAEFLPNKTASQCQAYYYLHKRNVGEFRRKIKKLSRASGRSAMILLRKSARRKPGRVL